MSLQGVCRPCHSFYFQTHQECKCFEPSVMGEQWLNVSSTLWYCTLCNAISVQSDSSLTDGNNRPHYLQCAKVRIINIQPLWLVMFIYIFSSIFCIDLQLLHYKENGLNSGWITADRVKKVFEPFLPSVSDKLSVFICFGFFCGRHLIGPQTAPSLGLLSLNSEQIGRRIKYFVRWVVLWGLLALHTLLSEVLSEYM